MKHFFTWVVLAGLMFAMTACGGREYALTIRIPAHTPMGAVYADTQICPAGQKVTIRMKPGSADTAVFLQPVEEQHTQIPEGTYLTGGAPVTLDAQRGVWYRVGIRGENPTDQEITVVLTVSGCELRIP